MAFGEGAFRRGGLAGALAVVGLGALLGGCSISFPIGSLVGEGEATASVKPAKAVSPLHPDLGPEDWRRAKAAMGVALDPQGSGKPVSWDNPETGIKGSFVPAGQPFVKADEICRDFTATLAGQLAASLRGTACLQGPQEWDVRKSHILDKRI